MRHQPASSRRANRGGFTLLEILLALALSVFVLATLGVAVDFYLRVVDRSRIEVEQAQLARAVLGRISEDLRGTVRGVSVDTSSLKTLAASSALPSGDELNSLLGTGGQTGSGSGSSGSGGNSQSGGSSGSGGNISGSSRSGSGGSGSSGSSTNTSGAGSSGSKSGSGTGSKSGGSSTSGSKSGSSGSSSSGSNSNNANANSASGMAGAAASAAGAATGGAGGTSTPSNSTSTTTTPPVVPGLYGSEYELQLDVSRLPRPDEYSRSADSQQAFAVAAPHDVRTVAYFMQSDTSPSASSATSGLVRRQVNRAVALFSGQQATDAVGQETVNLAPEVTTLQFRYLDGQSWVTTWDSGTANRLPNAVEVAVEISAPGQPAANPLQAASRAIFGSGPASATKVYKLIVYIPSSDITPPPEATAEEDTTQSNTSQNNTSQQGSSTQGAASGS